MPEALSASQAKGACDRQISCMAGRITVILRYTVHNDNGCLVSPLSLLLTSAVSAW